MTPDNNNFRNQNNNGKIPNARIEQRPQSSLPRDLSEQNRKKRRPAYRRRKLGSSGMAVVLCTVLLVAALSTSVIHFITTDRTPEDVRDRIESNLIPGTSQEAEENPIEVSYVTVQSADVHEGDLILVNYENEYVFPPDESHLCKVYDNKTDLYSVAYSYYMLDSDVLQIFNSLIDELNTQTGDACILVNSTYRDLQWQQELYDDTVLSNGEEYAEKYVAIPGKSEHHTGLALDLTIRYPDGTYVLMKNYENYDLFNTLCVEFGFILRYPENKFYFTKINTEPWHYRYVGVPHSYVISKKNYCLEEYITYVSEETSEKNMLCVTPDGKFSACDKYSLPQNGYAIYYVPENTAGDTEIPIYGNPSDYTVSGDNVGGFVVAVEYGDVTLPEVAFSSPK